MNKRIPISIFFIFLFLFIISASQYSDCSIYGTCKPEGNFTLNQNITNNINQINSTNNITNNITNTQIVNFSIPVNLTQMDNITVITLKESWLNSLYFSITNFTSTIANYYTKSEVDNNLSLYYLKTNPNAFINSTYTYNKSQVDSNFSLFVLQGSSNQITLDYLNITNPFNFTSATFNTYNSTWDNRALISGFAKNTTAEIQSLMNNTMLNLSSIQVGTLFANNTRVGIGTTAPDGKLHVMEGSAGTVTASVLGDTITAESNSNAGVSILNPDASAGYLLFGSPSNNGYVYIKGIYNGGLPQMQFYTDLLQRVVIDSSGNVGIGTTTPSQKLDVRGQGNFSGTIYINNVTDISTFSTAGFAKNTTAEFQSSLNNTNMKFADLNISNLFISGVFYDASGNHYSLADLNTTTSVSGFAMNTTAEIQALLAGTNISQFALNQTGGLVGINTTRNSQMLLNNTNMNFASLGIGTTSPTHTLNVVGNSNLSGNVYLGNSTFFVNSSGSVRIGGSTVDAQSKLYISDVTPGIYPILINSNTGSTIPFGGTTFFGTAFGYNGPGSKGGLQIIDGYRTGLNILSVVKMREGALTTLFTINNDSSVGINIGVNAPTTMLDVNGNVSLNNTLYVQNNGKVGIGTATPSSKLSVVDSATTSGYAIYSNATATGVGTTAGVYGESNLNLGFGGFFVNNAATIALKVKDNSNSCTFGVDGTSWVPSCSSDALLKNNIQPITDNEIKEISDWTLFYANNMKKYQWNSNNETGYSDIAEELQLYYPKRVSTDSEGLLSVNTPTTTEMLITIAHQQQAITDLQNKLDAICLNNGLKC